MDPMSLLVPDSALVVSLKDSALMLHAHMQDKLYPNPPGIYVHGSLMPIVQPSQKMFALGTGVPVTYQDLIEGKEFTNDEICNEEGMVLIPRSIMQNRSRLLSTGGFYPISAIQTLKHYVDSQLRNLGPYVAPFTNDSMSTKYLKPEFRYYFSEDILRPYVVDVIHQAEEFISRDTWRMYFTKVMADDLYIERHVDYRIYDWTRQQYEKHNPTHSE